MNCRDLEPLLGAYFDGELDLVRTVEVEAHLRECAGCAKALDRLDALRSVILAHAPYHAAPNALRRKFVAHEHRTTWWPALATATACILAVVFLWRAGPRPMPSIESEIITAHVRSLMGDHLFDIPSSDRHTVKPWFTGKLNFSPRVEDLSAQGFTLVGGRLDYLDGHPVAALVYKRRQHTINVFTWPTAADSGRRSESAQGFNVVHWTSGGMTWWAISDLNAEELSQLAGLLS